MKKYWLSAFFCALTPLALAQDLTPGAALYAGVGVWQPEFSGQLGDTDTDLDDLGFDDTDVNVFYVALEHPVPVLPNVRVELADIDESAVGTISESFTFEGVTFDASAEVQTDIELSYIDATLYYEVAMFDFGLTFRSLDASVSAATTDNNADFIPQQSVKEEVDGVLPMLYGATKIDIPGTGLFITGAVNGISYDDNSVIDYRIAAGYEMELSVLASLGAEIGLRNFTIETSDDEDYQGEIELSGAYARINIQF